jgi:hypothetical protein
VAYDNNERRIESVYSKRIRAGKRRTYFFDVRATRSNDYFLTITESRKKFDGEGYDRHKIFLYKEDFNKFVKALVEAVDYVKTDLMPDFDFDAFNHDFPADGIEGIAPAPYDGNNPVLPIADAPPIISAPANNNTDTSSSLNLNTEEVDKW